MRALSVMDATVEVKTGTVSQAKARYNIGRDSVIQLLKKWGVPVSERKLSIDEIEEASKNGKLEEIFASGTAAVISPIGTLCVQGEDYTVGDGNVGPLAQKLYDNIYGMQTGKVEDYMGWVYPLGLKA